MVPVHYCPDHLCSTISSGALKLYAGFQNFKSESLYHCECIDPQGRSWRSPYQYQKNIDHLQI